MGENSDSGIVHPSEDIMRELIKHVKKYGAKYGNATGAFLVREGEVVSKAVTTVDKDSDPTAHAEMKVIRNYCKENNTLDLSDCYLYVTREPCPMCAGAIVWANVGGVVHGWKGMKFNKLLEIPSSHIFATNENLKVHDGFMCEETKDLTKMSKNESVRSFFDKDLIDE